jgi:hypothetical protein
MNALFFYILNCKNTEGATKIAYNNQSCCGIITHVGLQVGGVVFVVF